MWEFIKERHQQILYNSFQHAYLVVLSVVTATVIAVLVAALVTRLPRLAGITNTLSAIGLTIPGFASSGS